MATKADLRNKVLRYLSVLPEGQDASPHQETVVGDAIDQAQAELETKGVAYWSLTTIPNDAMTAYARFVAARVALELLDPERAGPYVAGEGGALAELRSITAKAPQSAPARHCYF